METSVISGQTLLDLALQCYGSAESVVRMAIDNGRSITDDLPAGDRLKYGDPADRQVQGYYTQKGINPATGFDLDSGSPGGIGYWVIELDNVVM